MANNSDLMKMVQINSQQRAAVLGNAIEMQQEIFSASILPSQQTVINVAPRNVGLLKGFLIEVSGQVTNGAGAVAALSNFGVANMIRNFTFTDLNNYQRVNISGYACAMLNAARQGWVFGGAYDPRVAIGFGNGFPVIQGPPTLAAAADGTVRMMYYIPIAYSGDDLRGAIYSAIVSATMNLQITINPTPFVGPVPAADQLNAIYTNNAAGGWRAATPVNIVVSQIYLDQIPVMDGGPILPFMDLNTVYDLKQTTQTGIQAGTDFTIPYSNFRDFLSTTAIFNNANSYNFGTDVNYFALQSANFVNIFRKRPSAAALDARQVFMSDLPGGTYYFNHRNRPLNTTAFGNMELVVNAASAGAGSYMTVIYEALAQQTTLASGNISSLSVG